MFKRCQAWKLYCDACGAQIGGAFDSKESAIMYALCGGCAKTGAPYFYCSVRCRDELEKSMKGRKEEKDA